MQFQNQIILSTRIISSSINFGYTLKERALNMSALAKTNDCYMR